MCTVSFIARKQGYLLGMNRDEQLTRARGLPPQSRLQNGVKLLCPSEPGGGTWIALNESGVTLALINWYSVAMRVQRRPVSRGEVVNAAGGAGSPDAAQAALRRLPLRRINPFRLIGIFPATQEVVEWRWNLRRLARRNLRWKSQQWISSGFNEPEAQRIRGRAFRLAKQRTTFGRVSWLRRLHGSHQPECGPFSICMHRADAATVSYTEIVVARGRGTMIHHAGPPCRAKLDESSLRLELRMKNAKGEH